MLLYSVSSYSNEIIIYLINLNEKRLVIYCFEKYDREKADGMFIKREQMDAAICDLFKSKREELAKNPYVGDKRSYIFIAACVLFKAIYDKLQPDGLVASLKSAKDGIVASLIERDKKCQN